MPISKKRQRKEKQLSEENAVLDSMPDIPRSSEVNKVNRIIMMLNKKEGTDFVA